MAPLTFVSVVFDAEVTLLELQARSISINMHPEAVDRIFIIDNCLFGLGRRRKTRLLKEYGALASRVAFVRTRELFDRGATTGWRSQQAAKILIAQRVETKDYVALDAKNHFIRPVAESAFISDDGRARGSSHSYAAHPLRSSLVNTLRYLQADAEEMDAAIASFPPTATPFVLRAPLVRQMISDIEASSETPFAEEFEAHRLLEFFLYSGWVSVRGPGLESVRDDSPLPSPTVWPKAANLIGVEAAVEEASDKEAFVFAVHRQALARADRSTRDRIAAYWTEANLFTHAEEAHAFIRRFDRSYGPALVMTRLAERIRRVTGKLRLPKPSSPR